MIDSIKQAIVNKLLELFPSYTIYDEDIPQNFKKKSFLITLTDQDYNKRLNNKSSSLLSFDISYFSNKSVSEIKSDCLEVQLKLLRGFDLIGTHRVISKQVTITDNVLHFTFNVNYFEIKVEKFEKMQEIEDIKTNI